MNKIEIYLLTKLLQRVKIIYEKDWTGNQLSQIDGIIWKINHIKEYRQNKLRRGYKIS